jgi:hypothetical protein
MIQRKEEKYISWKTEYMAQKVMFIITLFYPLHQQLLVKQFIIILIIINLL